MTCVPNSRRSLWIAALALPILAAGCADLPGWMVMQRRATVFDYEHFDNATIHRADREVPLEIAAEGSLQLPAMSHGESFEAALEHSGTTAFIIVQHGRLLMEKYYNGSTRESTAASFSAAKSFVSALVGIALSEGKISSIDDPITRYLPELERNDPGFSRITLRHLLEMRSGIRFEENYDTPWDDAAAFYLTDDLLAKVTQLAIERHPDEVFHYSSGDTQLLGLIVQRATEMPLPRYLQEKIWRPMGAGRDASWSLDSFEHGNAKAFCCLNARPLDYARFGMLFLENGRLNGVQIVPADWVRMSTETNEHQGSDLASHWNVDSPGKHRAAFYTWHWRRAALPDTTAAFGIRPSPDFYAQGLLGQYIYVAPEQQMVIVRFGQHNGKIRWPALFRSIAELNPVAPTIPVESER